MDRIPKNIAILIFLIFILLNSCKKEIPNKPVHLEVWFHSGQGVEREVLNRQISRFNKLQNEIIVEAILLPEGAYTHVVQASAILGELPDILDFDSSNLYNYTEANHLIPLNKYITKELNTDILPTIIEQGTYNGKVYSLGQMESGLALWGNKSYLEKANIRIPNSINNPWSQEEFIDALKKLKKLPQVGYPIDFNLNSPTEWLTYGFSPILQSFGGDLINRSNYKVEGFINGEESIFALKFLQSLFINGYTSTKIPTNAFSETKTVGLSYVGHWMWEDFKKGLGDNLILLPMPQFGEKVVTGMGSWCWGITRNSKHPDSAWKFLSYLMENEQILEMTSANGAMPSRISALELSTNYKKGGPLHIYTDQLINGLAVPRPKTLFYPIIAEYFASAVNNIINGADVQFELNKAADNIIEHINSQNSNKKDIK